MFSRIREALNRNDWNVDNAYSDIVSEEKLFGQAYYGWSATPYQRKKMSHIWRGVLFVKYEECPHELMPTWQKESIGLFLDINQKP